MLFKRKDEPGEIVSIVTLREEIGKLHEELEELKAATTKQVGTGGLRGYWFGVPIWGKKEVTVQEQLDMLFKHLGLSLQYEAGKEASVKLVDKNTVDTQVVGVCVATKPDKAKPRKAK